MPAKYNLHYLIVLEGEAAQQFVQGLQKYSGDEKDDEQDGATDTDNSDQEKDKNECDNCKKKETQSSDDIIAKAKRDAREGGILGKGSVPYNGKAWGGTNFIGPGPNEDPYNLNLTPIDAIDEAAQRHDKAYYDAKTGGISGAVFNSEVLAADMILVQDAIKIMNDYKAGKIDKITNKPISERTYNLARGVYISFGAIVAGV